ncbi:hypothetical protein [Cyanobium sp. Morenito 9A2]|uniref:hypothetical protein n=1 Tax=Cyanobium sp. Morenito 9A2 TaxID=2823718 RepID=UPI0020CE0761|nr:hypothetical protein [Cyanobium sp. Morenito 9A2]MCP9851241.1 hypothetical protein [Cyanobium sp. Morenito 9A2]
MVRPAWAEAQEQCQQRLDQRDAFLSQALQAEITLAKRIRERLCPALSRQAEAANAADKAYAPLDYQALMDCRHRAEAQLHRRQSVLYRDRFGLVYYTPQGAELAAQADGLTLALRQQGCPYGNR